MYTQNVGVLCLQDGRCTKEQASWMLRRLQHKLVDQAKLFYSLTPPTSVSAESAPLRVDCSTILTNHEWCRCAHHFQPDPTDFGVLSSLRISKSNEFSIQILNIYWPQLALSSMTGSL